MPLDSSRRSLLVLIAANLVFALVIVLAVAFQSWRDRAVSIENGYGDLDNIASSLSAYTNGIIEGMEGFLRSVDVPPSEMDSHAREDLAALMAGIQEFSRSTKAAFMLDSQGELVVSSPAVSEGNYREQAREALAIHRAMVGHTYLGTPYRWHRPGGPDEWVVNLSRGIRGSDGGFEGIVVSVLSLDYLLELFSALDLGQDALVVLFNHADVMVARSPMVESFIGVDYTDSTLLSRLGELRESGETRFELSRFIDGLPRVAAWRPVPVMDGNLVVGYSKHGLLAGWRSRTVFNVLIGVLAIALFVAGSVLVATLSRRRRELETGRTRRLKLVAERSAVLSRSQTIDELMATVTATARELIGAHQAVTSLTVGTDFSQTINAVELSDKYARWRDYDEPPDGTGIYRLVCDSNRPMCLTQRELEAHPDWKGFGAARDSHPPMNGWLAVPLIAGDGRNLGLIQLSDKYEGDFTQDDVSELQQLATITGVAIENLRTREALEQAASEARRSQREIETIFSSISDAVYALDRDWRFVLLNERAEQLLQRSRGELLHKVVWDEFPATVGSKLEQCYRRAMREGRDAYFDYYYEPLGIHFDVRVYPHEEGLTVYFQDITQRLETEERLRQAQKMEAVGQLTGGVAHDFNNLLTVILGTTESLLEDSDHVPAPVRSQLELVKKAGDRAAVLTRRLLAFARKQPLDPRSVNVNDLLVEFEDILRRTLGATIDIELVRGCGLWPATVDPHELQNAILNLAINARDAMPEGGKLTIETANTFVEGDYADRNSVAPGQYVMVAVSDTGTGMSPEIIARAFDPFFTTKASGRGSGLGLSMVYGFARQSEGFVNIYSEPGEGTTIRLYLPRASQRVVKEAPTAQDSAPVVGGKGHILLVEDEDMVRQYAKTCLEMLGYDVVACAEGQEALRVLEHEAGFDLLLTDVVLPGGLSGRQLADECQRRCPGLPVLYMSGYTENAIVHHGRLDPGVALLNKPFRRVELEARVRQLLGHSL